MATDIIVTWERFAAECDGLANRWRDTNVAGVWGIPIGGSFVALEVARRLGKQVVDQPGPMDLVVDDLVDTGATMRSALNGHGARHDALFRKPHSPTELAPAATAVDGWLRFPWERDGGDPTDAVRRLLEFLGEDPTRDGLVGTPGRVVRALSEMTAGYNLDPAVVLATTFQADCDEMVVVRGVPFTSLCEHHMLPFSGSVTLGYIPADGRVVGLSKLGRLVEVYARRLQLQERLTVQIADAMESHLRPQGVGVVVRAVHSCMACRGVGKQAEMVTSRLRGLIFHAHQSRQEFMALAVS